MPKYRSIADYARHFPTLGLHVEPGEVIERDENPDGNFFELVEEKPKAAKAATEESQEN